MTDKALIRRPITQPTEILNQLQSGQLLKITGSRGNAIIICHRYHAEIAGPGAAIGGAFDFDCKRVIPLGKISLVYPESRLERQQAYAVRQRWLGFTKQAMNSYVPLERAHKILTLLYKYFEPQIIDKLPDEIIAQLVGVMAKTVRMVRPSVKPQSNITQQQEQIIKI
jgi:hypothetical protein